MTTQPLPAPDVQTPTPRSPEGAPAATRHAPIGPYAPTVAAGLVGMLVAGFVLVVHLAGVRVDPVHAAPWAMLGVGLLLLAAGALALARRPGGPDVRRPGDHFQ